MADEQIGEIKVNTEQLKVIIEHFRGKPVNDNVLAEYCNVNKFDLININVYEDFLYQYEHDERLGKVLGPIMEVLSRLKNLPTLALAAEKKEINVNNDGLSVEVCALLEEHGILYQDIDLICKGLAQNLAQVLTEAGVRANNMAAKVLAHAAKKAYGDPLTMKTLGEAYRNEKLQ